MLYAAQYQANETLPNGLRIAPRNPMMTSRPQFEAKQALNHSSIGSFGRSTTWPIKNLRRSGIAILSARWP